MTNFTVTLVNLLLPSVVAGLVAGISFMSVVRVTLKYITRDLERVTARVDSLPCLGGNGFLCP